MRKITRRDFLKLSVLTGGTAALAACGGGATEEAPAAEVEVPETGGEAPALDLPFEISADAINPLNMPEPVTAEGVFFSGGFGHEYIQYAADLFAKVHPGSEVTVEPTQSPNDTLRPRFVGGNPPDVIDNSGAGQMDMGALVSEGQLLDLGPLMKAASLDTPGKTVEETLFPGSQADGVFEGVQYALNIAYTIFGTWYSGSLFEEKGWTYPTTWSEMMDLCETIKSAGIAPWTYQGKYPYYLFFGLLSGLIYKKGGIQPMIDIDNLVDGAWGNAAVVDSLKEMHQLAENDYILTGTEGLNHTESQAEWLKGSAAFIPCGTWLENEMKELIPDGFDMMIGQVPGEGDACEGGGGEPFIVPSKAANPVAGMEFLRCQISKDSAKWFAGNISALMPVIGGTEGVELSTGTASASAMAEVCVGNVFPGFRYPGWYNDLKLEGDAKMGDMMNGRVTPDEYVEAVQAMADKVKADPEVTKFTRES